MNKALQNHFYHDVEGADDWQEVTAINLGGGYDWNDMLVFYSPSARNFFWLSGSGCSCNSLGDDTFSAAGFENGDRIAAANAVVKFCAESYENSVNEAQAAVRAVKTFKPAIA